ncbi:hypothetical protein PCANC_10305 [Puccinia coronata f. sp. avenae]|uniref:Uncharacterized protein n=1 Tax=Puccinia coronata f. sp. avenae TaxID=200324 RepID=A0A2N5VQ95_9BASI|nr:hypothetical protein PCANC_10305 [Puccinia coronata f. sp. avenae]
MTRIELAKHSGAFNNSKLKLHHGAIDPNEISSKLPGELNEAQGNVALEEEGGGKSGRPQTSSSTSQQIGVLTNQFSHISTGPNVLSATGAAGSAGCSLGSTSGARLLPLYAKYPSAGLNSIWSGGELGDF